MACGHHQVYQEGSQSFLLRYLSSPDSDHPHLWEVLSSDTKHQFPRGNPCLSALLEKSTFSMAWHVCVSVILSKLCIQSVILVEESQEPRYLLASSLECNV